MRNRIDRFEKADFGELRKALETHLESFHPDLEFDVGDIKWTELDARMKITVSVNRYHTEEFRDLVEKHNLDENRVAEGFKLRGYDGNRRTKPVLLKRVRDNKPFAVTVQMAEVMFGREK